MKLNIAGVLLLTMAVSTVDAKEIMFGVLGSYVSPEEQFMGKVPFTFYVKTPDYTST
ncbi:hypothetical protein JW979_10550 [bacterium]|nr:hypothetical protein [candidate division CSSED10-310 bacterium]